MAGADVMMYNDSDEDTPFQSRKTKNRIVLSDSDEDAPLANPINTREESSSEDENEKDLEDSPKPKPSKKRIARVESDSEDEKPKTNVESHNEKEDKSSESEEEKEKPSKKNKRIVRVDSDSDNDNQGSNINDNASSSEDEIAPRKKSIGQDKDSSSDSEDRQEVVKSKRVVASKAKFKDILFNKLHKKKSKENSKKSLHKSKAPQRSPNGSSESDSEDNAALNSTLENEVSGIQFSNKDLYDAESSEESSKEDDHVNHKSAGEQSGDKAKAKRKANKKDKKVKPAQRKSSAEALEKIHAETQRLIRESNVSLPYFLPKQRSISEFLEKRKPIPSIPLRAKGEALGSYINLYEERVRSIKQTYQQDSDDESENKSSEKSDTTAQNKENIADNLKENTEKSPETEETTVSEENTKTINSQENTLDNPEKALDSQTRETKESQDPFDSLDPLGKDENTEADSMEMVTDTIEVENDGTSDETKADNSDETKSDEKDNSDSDFEMTDATKPEENGKVGNKIDGNNPDHSPKNHEGEKNVENGSKLDNIVNRKSSKGNEKLELNVQGKNEDIQSKETLERGDKSKRSPDSKCSENADPSPSENSSQSTSKSSPSAIGGKETETKKSDLNVNQQNKETKKSDLNLNQQNKETKKSDLNVNQQNKETKKSDLNVNQPKKEAKKSDLNVNQQNGIVDLHSKQGSSVSQQGDSECNIFNLTESELMEEDEYAADLCDDIDTRPDDAKQSSEKAAVKKKLFTDWTDSIRPPSDDEDVTNQPLEPPNRKFGIPSNQPITLKPTNGSDDFIELDDDIRPSSNLKEGARRLLERAMKHTAAKVKPAGQTVSLNITTTERDSQGEITGYSSEALSIVLEDNAELAKSNRGAECVPGARRVVLKKQLEEQMAKNREKAWMRRIEEAKMDEETYAGEKSDCEADKDEEEEFDEEELTTEEDEEEENIMEKPRKKKKRVKSAFVDEEAEVSDEEGVSADEEEDEEEGDKEEEEEDDKEEEDEEESKDVNDEDKPSQVEESPRSLKSKSKTFDMFMTQKTDGNAMECDDDELPAYQMGMNTEQSNGCTPAHDKVVFSPVVTLTGCDKTVSKSRNASFLLDSQPTSPLHHSPKKLNFDDEPSTLELGGLDNLLPSQTKGGEDLEALFSGQFSTQAPVLAELEQNDGPCDYQTQTQAVPQGVGELLGNTCSSNLSGLCSGAFTSQPIDPKLLEINDGTCGKFITSTSMDENETPMPEAAPTLVLNKSSILSSDDEDDLDTSIQMKKQTKTLKRLVYSDDEEEDKDNEGEDDGNEGEDDEDNEEDDLEEKEGGEDESDIEQEEGADVLEAEYDSEENEIVARKVGDFFEAEAELSESEWGSEDEDENEMDKMEQEEADKEYHDQDQLKEELGKIHMKQILDDDNREVKLLQEMLLEDGELHSDGPGRQRQFRWSNVDDNADLRITAHFSDDSEPEDKGEDKEEDETWRKISLERELYLESQKDKLEQMELLEAESSSSEVTRTVILNDLKNKVVRAAESKVPSELPIKSPDSKLHALMGLHKRNGSFLTRGAQSWVRLSKITQGVGDDMDRKIVKKRGNFVFAALESGPEPSEKPAPQQPETPKADDKVQPKRKKSLATPPLLKKLKLHDGSQSNSSMLSKLMQADF